MNKLILILCLVNTLAIIALCIAIFFQMNEQSHMWDMFQDFEKLLIDILMGRMETKDI